MKVCVDGIYRNTTTEEEEELTKNKLLYDAMQKNAPAPTIEERVASVEEDTAIIRAILMGEETSE